VLSELTRPRPNVHVVRWFDAQDATALFVSVLTLGEIEKGVGLLPGSRKKAALTSWLGTLRSTYAARILPIDTAVASIWGRTAARAERLGRPLGVIDGLIAATAVHHAYSIVTRNVDDFATTGAPILNVWEA
jgi:toxin FitB